MPKPDPVLWRPSTAPRRQGLSTEERWHGDDCGLIICWEVGREVAESNPSLAEKARKGELPTLAWKGGANKKLKVPRKYGPYQYLATWQGLRRDDLHINKVKEVTLTCSRTGVTVTYTGDPKKYANP